MIGRVTQNSISNEFLFYLKDRMVEMNKRQIDLTSMSKIRMPEDDPVGTTMSMQFQSRLREIETYIRNIEEGEARLNLMDSNLQSATDILHRVRELTVQAANGTYTKDDTKKMAIEVDQLIRELVNIANAYYKQTNLYGGYKTDLPFRVEYGLSEELDYEVVKKVVYMGDDGVVMRQADTFDFVQINLNGNRLFASENMVIKSSIPGTGFIADRDMSFKIDGVEVKVYKGDTLEVIVEKINSLKIPVKAYIDNSTGNNFLTLESTIPHNITVEDVGDGDVMERLGIVRKGAPATLNYNPEAKIYVLSLFDVLIKIRDDMLAGRQQNLGGEDLSLIDNGLDNFLRYRAEIGARAERLKVVNTRLNADIVYVKDILAKTQATDIPQTVVELRMLELTHQAGLQVGARLMGLSLLNFLR
ncbi:MAG: flagellar hook-associated protein 3 [Brevinematales bacterium]|nr:flagellar hook-associated protein 3 [Brevinematales bacterium]